MKAIVFLVAALFAMPSLAQKYFITDLATGRVAVATCPGISQDFSTLLAKLDALKATVKKDANCAAVADTIGKQIGDVDKDRSQILDLIDKAQTTPLTPIQAKQISAYVASVTQKVGALIDLISGSNQCFSGDANKGAITSLSGIVGEAASLVSQLAGPWGAPIVLGGQIISGFLTGLDKILQTRTGYSFDDRGEWTAYVNDLCTYYTLREQVNGLLHPEDQIAKLQAISQRLDQNMSTISSANQTTTAMTALGDRVKNAKKWVQSEIDRVQTEANSYWNNVTGKQVLSQAADELEEYLVDREAPRFLSHQSGASNKSFTDLSNYLYNQGLPLLQQAQKAGVVPTAPLMVLPWWNSSTDPSTDGAAVYKVLSGQDWRQRYKDLHRESDDLEYRLLNGAKAASQKFDMAAWEFGVESVFCDFFRDADLYSASLQTTCTSRAFQNLQAIITDMMGASKPSWLVKQPSLVTAPTWTEALDQWSEQIEQSFRAQ